MAIHEADCHDKRPRFDADRNIKSCLAHMGLGQGLEGFIGSFASGYAIAVIPAVTKNAWGSALVQTLTDAVGRL